MQPSPPRAKHAPRKFENTPSTIYKVYISSKQTTTMKPKDLQSVIEIRKALIEQGENTSFLYLDDAYQWVIDAPEEERDDRLFAAVQALKTKKFHKDVYDWVFKGKTFYNLETGQLIDSLPSI